MTSMKYFAAISHTLGQELRRDPSTILLGEDIAQPEGIYGESRGLLTEFGPDRVRDTPAGEVGYFGAAVGAALTGLRPIIEISFADFLPMVADQIVNQAAKMRFMSGGQVTVPLTVLSFAGAGLRAGPQHSSMHEGFLAGIPGIKVVTPATASDVKGLLAAAVRDDSPVFVLFHKGLLQLRDDVPDNEYLTPIGEAIVKRVGNDLTIVAWSKMVHTALKAADLMEQQGVSVEVIDVRSVQPLDTRSILASVYKTHRALIVHESSGFGGVGAEIAATIADEAFDWLDCPVRRLTAPFGHVPYSPVLEDVFVPDAQQIVKRAMEMLR